MTIYELRLECLRLADTTTRSGIPSPDMTRAVIVRAQSYIDFVLGTRDAEIIDAARELAAKVRDATG